MIADASGTNGHPKKAAFLAAYAASGVIRIATEAAGIHRNTHYKWLKDDSQYAEAFSRAHSDACDSLENEARRRAVEGWDEPVFYEGGQCGTKRKYSDTLLIFLLKANHPTKFGDKVETTHKGDASPVQIYIPENRRKSTSGLN